MLAQQKWFLVCALLAGFFIGCEYAIVRPVSNALFITAYTSSFLPFAWLAGVPLNLMIVSLYNQYLPRIGCLRMFRTIALVIVGLNVFFGLFVSKYHVLPFLFYIWKEIYILLILQQLWSVIHATIDLKSAKHMYGLLFGAGALGAILGSSIPSFCAVSLGSENLLFLSLPLYACLFVTYTFLMRFSGPIDLNNSKKEGFLTALSSGFGLIKKSKLLLFILMIVTCMQISATLIDYQFNAFLEKTVFTKDLRTEYSARILGIVQVATLCLQLFGSFAIVHWLGLKKSHFLVPLLLCLYGVGFLFFPVFPLMALSFITIKSFDFSLFGVIKEMLYIPMSSEEKFRAKAIIDILAYRSSKALASLCILSLQALCGSSLVSVLATLGIGVFCLWCLAVAFFFNPSVEKIKVDGV